MKILTLNTWQERGPWRERWEVIFAGLEKLQPDIISFQELFSLSWAAEIQKRTGFSATPFPKENVGLLLCSRYALSNWGVTTLSKSPLEEYFRYVLWAELQVKGKRLFVFNTHFSWMLEDSESRKKQAEEVLGLVNEKAPQGEVILMGDFNAPHLSPEINSLIVNGRFSDLFFLNHRNDSGYTWDNRNPYVAGAEHQLPDRRIDFVLTRGPGPLLKNLVSCDLVFDHPNEKGVWASDHFGILAEFQSDASDF